MGRENRFVIMLTDQERQAVEALAKTEWMPASTFARRQLLLWAEQRGIAVPRRVEETEKVLA